MKNYIYKANIFSKRDNHKQAIKVFKEALNISQDSSEPLTSWNGISIS